MAYQKILVYILLFISGMSVIFSFLFGSWTFAVLSAFCSFLTILVWKYGYLLLPLVFRATNVVEIRDGYEIPPSRDCIVKKCEDKYLASVFLEVVFYESLMDKGEKEKALLSESFERALIALRQLCKISLLVSYVDISKYVDEIKTKRSIAETRLAKISEKKSDEAARLEREVSMWNKLLDRISGGEKPMEILIYAMTTAEGHSKEEAISRAKAKAHELKTVLSGTLNADVLFLYDTEMLKCFEWERFIPPSEEKLKDEVF